MIHLTWLRPDRFDFPPPEQALDEPNGLLAAGGDLSSGRLLAAYRLGIFPWYEEGQPILWWSPQPRTVLFPREIHISRSLRKTLRRGNFQVTADQCFREVVEACAGPRAGAYGTWITDAMLEAYCELHRMGYAHSIEVWQQGRLSGGLYGVAMGAAFFGESMFSRVSDASKIALVHLAGQTQSWGFGIIDCQVETGHLLSMGARSIPRAEFQDLLKRYTGAAYADLHKPGPWELDWSYAAVNQREGV